MSAIQLQIRVNITKQNTYIGFIIINYNNFFIDLENQYFLNIIFLALGLSTLPAR